MKKQIALIIGLALCAGVTHAAGIVDKIGFDAVAIARSDDMSKYHGSLGVRLGYDLTERIGIVIEADGSDTHGALIESTFAGLKFGLPVKFLGPVKPYLIGGGGLKFPGIVEYAAGGGGLEYRWKSLRLFVESGAEKSVETPVTAKGVLGVGFRF